MYTNIRNNLREYKFKSIYFKLLSLFIGLIFIPSITIGTFIYIESTNKFESEINKYNLYTLEYIQDEIGSIIDNVNNISVQYTMNGEVRYFSYQPFDSDRLALERISKMIGNTCLSYQYIDSMYIYYKQSNEIVTSNGVFNFNDFYDKEWVKSLDSIKGNNVILPTRNIKYEIGNTKTNSNIITYIVPFPIASTEKTGAIAINISVDKLTSILNSIKKEPSSTIFVINSDGKIILSDKFDYVYRNFSDMTDSKYEHSGNEKLFVSQFKGEKMVFSKVESNNKGWKFIEITPFELVKKNVAFIWNIIFILLIISIILLLAVFLITNKVYNPLVNLMDIIKTGGMSEINSRTATAKNELDMLRINMKDISLSAMQEREQNKALKNQVLHSKKILAKNLFNELILLSGEETEWVVQNLMSLEWSRKSYIVLLVSFDDYLEFQRKFSKKDQAVWKYCIINITEEIVGTNYNVSVFEDRFNQWIVILNIPDCDEQVSYNISKELSDKIREAINSYIKIFTVTVSIGSYCSDVAQLSESYENAVKVMQRKWLGGKDQTFSYKDMKLEKSDLYYNLEAEKNILYVLLYKNNLEEVNKFFDDFVKELLTKNNYIHDNVYQGIIQLLIAIMRMLHEKGIALEEIFKTDGNPVNFSILNEFRRQETLKDAQIWIKELFKQISDYLWEQRSDSNDESISSILDYISKYYNLDISLSVVADKFGYSGSQLSKLFKKATGENFIDYLSKIRIEKSKRLMMDSELSVTKIAEAVGYTNVQTFIRVFKKLEGMTPGQFKEDIKLVKFINN